MAPQTLNPSTQHPFAAMPKTAPKAAPTASTDQKVLESKWGKQAIAAGWTALPNTLFMNQKALGLKPLDVLVFMHLASYWWNPKSNPWPAKGKIAAALDVDPRTVQRSIQKMEKAGYVQRIARKASVGDNMTNEYDLRGMVKRVKLLAEEYLATKAAREAQDKAKAQTPKTFELIKGGKK